MEHNTLVSRIYHSREDRVAELVNEKNRLQYDGQDHIRLEETANAVEEYVTNLCEAVDALAEAVADSDQSEDEVNYCRRQAIEQWALAQAALSKTAHVLRFDGNIAYERMINALKSGAAVDMRGL